MFQLHIDMQLLQDDRHDEQKMRLSRLRLSMIPRGRHHKTSFRSTNENRPHSDRPHQRFSRLLVFLALVKEANRHKGIECSISISVMPNIKGAFGLARYRYEELSPMQFEDLVIDICRHVLGKATRGFAKGPDGGRDARFDGTANGFPSATSPWEGTTIIQAKHASRADASFSDRDFGVKSGVLKQELPRMEKLAKSNELDHYMLFANRHLGGNTDSAIVELIASKTGLSNSDIHIVGVEGLDIWLRDYPDISDKHHLDLLAAPLRITRENLAEVIEAMKGALGGTARSNGDKVKPRTPLERKNVLNGVKRDELEPLRKRYLKDTREIDSFLSNPINQGLLNIYSEAMDELNERLPQLIELRGSFIGAWLSLCDILIDHEETLRRNSKLTKSLLFYMYWHCDLGEDEDDARTE